MVHAGDRTCEPRLNSALHLQHGFTRRNRAALARRLGALRVSCLFWVSALSGKLVLLLETKRQYDRNAGPPSTEFGITRRIRRNLGPHHCLREGGCRGCGV